MKARITDQHYLLSLEDVGYYPVPLLAVKKGRHVKNAKLLLLNNGE